MSKKSLIFITIILLLLIVGAIAWFINSGCKHCITSSPASATLTKEVKLFSPDATISIDIPSDWNAFYNGDPAYITNFNNSNSQQYIGSVSTPSRPVTFSDINWTQLDFYITDSDLITPPFITDQLKKNGQAVELVTIKDFSGYVSTDTIQGASPTKADTGGQTFYLQPNVASPKWNLLVKKQAQGDAAFEAAVKKIIESLRFSL